MNQRHISLALGAALMAFPLSGCYKNDSTSMVNPDGSSKFSMVMELNLAPIMGMLGGGAPGAPNPLGNNRQILVQMVRSMNSSVDAWTEAKVETTKTGATKITLAGLTKDFTATGDLKKALGSANADLAEKAAALPDMKMITSSIDAAGKWTIKMVGIDEIMTMFGALQAEAAKENSFNPGQMQVSEDEITAKIEEFKPMYAQYKPMGAMFLKDMSITSEMEVAGEILDTKVFKKIAPNKVSWTFSGEQLIDMVDGMVNDPALAKKITKLATALNEGPKSDKVAPALREFITPMMSELYGGAAAPVVVIKPGAASFDFVAEVAKAKAGQSAELKKIIEEAAKPATLPGLPGSGSGDSTPEIEKPAPKK